MAAFTVRQTDDNSRFIAPLSDVSAVIPASIAAICQSPWTSYVRETSRPLQIYPFSFRHKTSDFLFDRFHNNLCLRMLCRSKKQVTAHAPPPPSSLSLWYSLSQPAWTKFWQYAPPRPLLIVLKSLAVTPPVVSRAFQLHLNSFLEPHHCFGPYRTWCCVQSSDRLGPVSAMLLKCFHANQQFSP